MKLYTELAAYYYEIEKPARDFDSEIKFLTSLLRAKNVQTVMDMGCGSGEHANSLHQQGFSCIGIDASQPMLTIARQRFPQIEFFHGTMQEYQHSSAVDALICLFGSINYLLTEQELDQFLLNLKKNLKTGGYFILEVWNAFPIRQIKRKAITSVSTSKIGKTLIQRNRGFRLQENPSDISLVEVNFIYLVNSKKIQDKHIMRVFYPDEIIQILQRNQLKVVETYSDYQKNPLKKQSSRVIIICQNL